jgi:hypothetical protein
MDQLTLLPRATEAARIELKSYHTTIPMGSLAIQAAHRSATELMRGPTWFGLGIPRTALPSHSHDRVHVLDIDRFGVDNIHHDVFLSPKFVQASRGYLFGLIRQSTKATYFAGIELRSVRGPDNTAFSDVLLLEFFNRSFAVRRPVRSLPARNAHTTTRRPKAKPQVFRVASDPFEKRNPRLA